MSAPSSRFMAIWLPHLPTDRWTRAGRAPPKERPFALYAKSGNAFILTAVAPGPAGGTLSPGQALADARALRPDLVAYEADPNADLRLLDRIGAWCERFTPTIALDPPDGLFLDIGGCAHLFGGEAGLRAAALSRLARQGFSGVRAAIADTPGAAWALARYSRGDDGEDLAPLPIAALRLQPAAEALMRRLGLKTIGQIIDAPRAPFSARAGQDAMRRLDQALGKTGEALSPRRPPPPVFAQRRLLEPITTLEGVLVVARDLCADLAAKLYARGVGVRALRLVLFGVDGRRRVVRLGLSRPETAASPILKLLKERLSVEAERFDAEFGFESARLDALEIAPLAAQATDLAPRTGRDPQAEARLVDTLIARLGGERIGRPAVLDAHAPERAGGWGLSETSVPCPAPEDGVPRRPLTLFTPAQPIEAMATVPDGPPLRFRWRRLHRTVVRSEGPERIAPNWLRAGDDKTRDYYRVEDETGRRYWLYREGFFGDPEPPRWFLHGVFA